MLSLPHHGECVQDPVREISTEQLTRRTEGVTTLGSGMPGLRRPSTKLKTELICRGLSLLLPTTTEMTAGITDKEMKKHYYIVYLKSVHHVRLLLNGLWYFIVVHSLIVSEEATYSSCRLPNLGRAVRELHSGVLYQVIRRACFHYLKASSAGNFSDLIRKEIKNCLLLFWICPCY